MKLYDGHTHLNNAQLYPDRQTHMQNFVEAGGLGLVNIGVDAMYNQLGLQIAQQSADLFPTMQIGCTVGIHPCDVVESNKDNNMIDKDIVLLNKLITQNKQYIRGIGECGTDLHRPCTPEQHQLQLYSTARQAELAQEYHLPLVIHSRSDWAGTYEVLREFRNIDIYLHCWGYTTYEIQLALDTWGERVYFGYGGVITYPKAGDVRDSLMQTPLSQIILETDAPYLPPQSHRGQTNYPHYISEIYQKTSDLLEIEIDQLCNQVEDNWKILYQRH